MTQNEIYISNIMKAKLYFFFFYIIINLAVCVVNELYELMNLCLCRTVTTHVLVSIVNMQPTVGRSMLLMRVIVTF